jgi:adenosylcobinamide-GDP ribazoletransferase
MNLRPLGVAITFLTVVPVPGLRPDPGDRLGRAFFPLVGAVVGLAAGAVYVVVSALAGTLVAAVSAVAFAALLTGGLHLDGLADAADGLLGGGDRERRLEIMRDPRLGSFGAIALVLVLVGGVASLSAMTPARALVALVVAGALSRLAMLGVVVLVPYARHDGLGVAAQGDHRVLDLVVGGLLTVAACVPDVSRSMVALLLVALTTLFVTGLARRRIGGATGDVYGACTEVGQLAALLVFAAR